MLSAFRYTGEVPIIETDRLRMRGHRLDDFDECVAMWSDPIVTRYIGAVPSSPQRTWARLLSYAGHWQLMGFGYWVIEEKLTGSYAGELGFADFRRDIAPSMKGVPELGWALPTRFHGRGYATEAVRAALAWGDKYFVTSRTVCLIDPDNKASINVAQKCGYREFDRALYDGTPAVYFARTHPSTSLG